MPRPARAAALLPLAGTLLATTPARAQQEPEPYQILSVAFGWGAVRPVGDHDLPGRPADGAAGLQFGLDLDVRQGRHLYVYGRLDADAGEVRQHLAVSGGVRVRPGTAGRLRPHGGAGVGLYWLEPKIDAALAIDRTFALRGEAHAGVEWRAAPGLQAFAEYRLVGARYPAVTREPDCSPIDRCLSTSSHPVLHLGHTGWVGARLKLF